MGTEPWRRRLPRWLLFLSTHLGKGVPPELLGDVFRTERVLKSKVELVVIQVRTVPHEVARTGHRHVVPWDVFLPDPGVSGVRSMGPSLSMSVHTYIQELCETLLMLLWLMMIPTEY